MVTVPLTREDMDVLAFMARHDMSAASYTEMVDGDNMDHLIMCEAEDDRDLKRTPAKRVACATYAYENADSGE